MREIFGDNLKRFRGERRLTQEQLAERLGVTAQAISKWECSLSYPDTETLVELADVLEVSLDALLRAGQHELLFDRLPDDGVLRVIQCCGRTVLTRDTYNPDRKIPLEIRREDFEGDRAPKVHVEIWGSADIKGSVSGGVEAGDSVNCGNVSGGVKAGDGVNCGNVSGDVAAGDGVNCGNVSGDVAAGDGVNCGNVSGGINAGDGITCQDIEGNIESCAGDIHCAAVRGDIVQCEGVVYVGKKQ